MTTEIYFAGEPAQGLGFYSVDQDGEPTEYFATKKACRQAIETGTAWSLTPQPAILPKRPEPLRNGERTRQMVLLTGLDCPAGTVDLFD